MISLPLLQGVPQDEVERVIAAARPRRFVKGEVVFHEEDHGDTLHIIVKGRFAVRVTTPYGDVATLVVLDKGNVFGEMALLEADAIRGATVVALEPAETLSIRHADFDDLRRVHPQVTEVLLSILAHTVRRLTRHLVEALYIPAEVRVIRRLLELAEVYGLGHDNPTIPLGQEDLGGLAGTSRATVNRVLRKEEERGTVSLKRGRTTILDRSALEQRAR